MLTVVLAIARPDAAIALANPVGLRFLEPEFPDVLRRHGIFFPPPCDAAPVEAIETASESVCPRACKLSVCERLVEVLEVGRIPVLDTASGLYEPTVVVLALIPNDVLSDVGDSTMGCILAGAAVWLRRCVWSCECATSLFWLAVPFPKPVNSRSDLDEVFFLTPFSFAESTTGSEADAEMPSSTPSPVIESGP